MTCARGLSLRKVLAAAYFSVPPLHEATDLRDLIYARLGLAEDPGSLEVKYKLSVAGVFIATSRFLLLSTLR